MQQFLTTPDVATSLDSGVTLARKWIRLFRRGKELQVVLPDPQLLVRGLDRLISKVITEGKAQSSSTFRIASFKLERQLDYKPTESGVLDFAQMILGELEAAILALPPTPTPKVAAFQETPDGDGNGKGKGKSKSKSKTGAKPCWRWNDGTGCRFGLGCSFAHDPLGPGHCWVCGSTEHMKPQCPYAGAGAGPEQAQGGISPRFRVAMVQKMGPRRRRMAGRVESQKRSPRRTRSGRLREVPKMGILQRRWGTLLLCLLDIVKEELEKWIPSMVSEYQSLTLENQAVHPFTQEQLDEWDRQGIEHDLAPGKTVHSKKAFTGRLKTRAVVCGNYIADSYSKAEKFAAGADGVLVRCCLRLCAERSWDIGALDIRTAFLLAPLLYREARPTIARAPRIFNLAKIREERFWRVDRAMYGLCTSPRSWSTYRDAAMKATRGRFRGKIVCFRQSRADESLWYILLLPDEGEGTEGGDESDTTQGIILVYVDDLLIAAVAALAREVSRMFQQKWRCSEPEWISTAGEVKFNGFEIRALEDGLEVHQNSYVQDLLERRNDVVGSEDVPAPPAAKFPAAIEDQPHQPAKVKVAQAIAGELQWLCGRRRPELTYGVNLMAQAISRSSDEALERGHQLIRFLRKHPTGGLVFPKDTPVFVGSRTTRTSPTIESFSDASFAPDGSRSQQAVQIYLNGALVAWMSSRQTFVTMSTAESELVSICEGVTALKSLEGLIAEMFVGKVDNALDVKKVVYTDSQAALAACQTSAGSWRTRHLRIRGSMLRELLDGSDWTGYHLEGNLMLADIGTKGLPAERFWQLMQLMGLDRPVVSPGMSRSSPEKVKRMLALMMIVALMPEVEAAGEVVVTNSVVVPTTSPTNYLLFMILMVVTIAVWEFFKGVVAWCCRGCRRPKQDESDDEPTPPPSPRTALPTTRLRERRARPAARDRRNKILTKVVMTPNGTCAHASSACSTLNVSQEFIERKLCTVCCKIR